MTISDQVLTAICRLKRAGFEPTSISMNTVPALLWASELGIQDDPQVHPGAANVVNGSRSGQPDGRPMVEVEPIILEGR